jgi:RNA polymerase sigma-70 factor (ECF subfamily)
MPGLLMHKQATTTDPDAALVQSALAGHLGAFEQLVERHSAVVYRVAARVVGREEPDDVTQETFLRAYHRLDRFRGDSHFRSWLLQIAHNSALNALRKRRPDPIGSVPEGEEDQAGRSPGGRSPVTELEDRERRERLESKLGELRDEHRVVLVLRDLEGLQYEEIAAVTETPVGSVKGRLHRARNELIDIMRNNAYDWELPR